MLEAIRFATKRIVIVDEFARYLHELYLIVASDEGADVVTSRRI